LAREAAAPVEADAVVADAVAIGGAVATGDAAAPLRVPQSGVGLTLPIRDGYDHFLTSAQTSTDFVHVAFFCACSSSAFFFFFCWIFFLNNLFGVSKN
jgi:hypothetical protein